MYKVALVRVTPSKWISYVFSTQDDFVAENVIHKFQGKSIRQVLRKTYRKIPRDKVDYTYLHPRK